LEHVIDDERTAGHDSSMCIRRRTRDMRTAFATRDMLNTLGALHRRSDTRASEHRASCMNLCTSCRAIGSASSSAHSFRSPCAARRRLRKQPSTRTNTTRHGNDTRVPGGGTRRQPSDRLTSRNNLFTEKGMIFGDHAGILSPMLSDAVESTRACLMSIPVLFPSLRWLTIAAAACLLAACSTASDVTTTSNPNVFTVTTRTLGVSTTWADAHEKPSAKRPATARSAVCARA
jgi:hypothetical protein